jgi:hypothetical protein
MKQLRLFALILSLVSVLTCQAVSLQKEDALLDQSYALSQKLSSTEQLYYLTELTRVSVLANAAPDKAQEWCLTLFRLASSMADARTRAAGQKNALDQLSHFNPVLAMELLPQIQVPKSSELQYEDVRSDAVGPIFEDFLRKQKPRDLSSIIAQARYVGQTGQYPYRAMAALIHHLPQHFNADINTILNDAVSSYRHETGFYNRDEEFLVLVKSLPKAPANPDLKTRVLSAFVQRVTKEPIPFPGDYYSEIHLPSGRVLPFTDRNRAFLFQAFPAVRQFNPSLAAQLQQEYPELDSAVEPMRYVSGGFVMGNPSSDYATEEHLRNVQSSLLERIKEQQDCNPQSAATLAQRVSDGSARIVAFSATVPALVKKSPTEAQVIYQKQLSAARELTDPSDKFRANVALAKASYYVSDYKKYEMLSRQSFDMGLVSFSEGLKDPHRIQRHQGFEELQDIVTFAASQQSDILKTKVQQLPEDWLKAYLLLYEIEGHRKRATRSVLPSCPN